MRHIIERSFLIRRVQRYEIDMADEGPTPLHMIETHFGEFDNDVCNIGIFQGEHDETVDDDQLTVTWVVPTPPSIPPPEARIIQFPRGS